jgi:hypothetical protein
MGVPGLQGADTLPLMLTDQCTCLNYQLTGPLSCNKKRRAGGLNREMVMENRKEEVTFILAAWKWKIYLSTSFGYILLYRTN